MMKNLRRQNLALAAALILPATGAFAADTNQWSFSVSPYLWVATIDLTTSLPSSPPGVDHFETRISAGAMLAAQARYKSIGLFVDATWLRLETEPLNPGPAFSGGNLQSDFLHTTVALTYTLPLRGKFHAEVLTGARIWYVNEDIKYDSGTLPGFKTSGDRTWADPIIGMDLRYDISQRWFAIGKGIVGGFGVSTEFASEVFAGVGYRFNEWSSATIGYRYLHEDYDRNNFEFSLDANGILLGISFHF